MEPRLLRQMHAAPELHHGVLALSARRRPGPNEQTIQRTMSAWPLIQASKIRTLMLASPRNRVCS
jgi:hypothetical protein